MPGDEVDAIAAGMAALNDRIASDRGLGPQFRVGHSYVTPPKGQPIDDVAAWFDEVIETEIRPLLDEYWFDAPDKVAEAAAMLRAR